MEKQGTPVPHGYFYATAMLQHAGELLTLFQLLPIANCSTKSQKFKSLLCRERC